MKIDLTPVQKNELIKEVRRHVRNKEELQDYKNWLNSGADIDWKSELNRFGWSDSDVSILIFAIYDNIYEIAKFAIENGIDVNAKTKQGFTPLMYVTNLEMAKLLIANGADVNATNSVGETALIHLIVYEILIIKVLGSESVKDTIRVLLENGARVCDEFLEEINEYINLCENEEIRALLLKANPKCQILI